MIALDASVVIAFLEPRDAHHDAAVEMLESTGDELLIGVVTMAEVLVGPIRAGQEVTVESALRAVGVDERPLPADAAVRLARLRASTRLRLPDCSVLLLAQTTGAGVATFDSRLRLAALGEGLRVV